eukprot:scaffold2707_cov417-Prasinococcus_capsulatus_cf.AAC.25
MAPEFFFRGPKGAYEASHPELLALGDKIQQLVADPIWKDWIFVFGSIIGFNYQSPSRTPGGVVLRDTYDFCVVQRGNSTERVTHFKRYISFIDFLSVTPNQKNAVIYPNMNLGVDFEEPTSWESGFTMQYPLLPADQVATFERHMGPFMIELHL